MGQHFLCEGLELGKEGQDENQKFVIRVKWNSEWLWNWEREGGQGGNEYHFSSGVHVLPPTCIGSLMMQVYSCIRDPFLMCFRKLEGLT